MKLTSREPTPEMVEAERVKFEAWCDAEGIDASYWLRCDKHTGYENGQTADYWTGWKARARHDAAWNAAAAHAQGLREQIKTAEDNWAGAADICSRLHKRIAELERDNANLKTVMVAAAEEIHAHWDAHCDAEGYGPQNLMRRLEEGIPSEYGYTAGAFAAQQKRISELEAQRVPLTKAEITACCNESDTYKTGVWMRVHETTLERLVRAIERAHGVEERKN